MILFPVKGKTWTLTRMCMQLPEKWKKTRAWNNFNIMLTPYIPYVDNFATYHLSGRHKHKDMIHLLGMLVEEMLNFVFTYNPKYFYLTALIHTEGCSIRYMDMIRLLKFGLEGGCFERILYTSG